MYPNLRAEMARNKITPTQLAEALDVTVRTMYEKLGGKADFTFPQALRVRDVFFPGQQLEYLFQRDPGA